MNKIIDNFNIEYKIENKTVDGVEYWRMPLQSYLANEWGQDYTHSIETPWMSKQKFKMTDLNGYYSARVCLNRDFICNVCNEHTTFSYYDSGYSTESTCNKCGKKGCYVNYSHFQNMCRYVDGEKFDRVVDGKTTITTLGEVADLNTKRHYYS